MGYTPSLAAGVWTGNNDNTPMTQGADGSYVASPIWRAFMEKALQNYNIEQFPKYEEEDAGKDILNGKLDETVEVKVCKVSGKKDTYCLANDNCPDSKVDKKKFTNGHSILYYVNKDDPRGDVPKDPGDDPQFKNWEKAINKYLEDGDKKVKAPPDEECRSKDFD